MSTFVLNKVARQLSELELADRLHSHLLNNMNSQTYLQNNSYMPPNPNGAIGGHPNGGGTQGQPLYNFGGIPFPPPNIPAGPAQKFQPSMFGMSGPPKVASHDQDVPGQTGVQPRYLEEIEQHLRSESQADSTRCDCTMQQKAVFAGESIDDPQKKEERPPLTGEGSRKNMNRTTSGEPSMVKQKSRRLTQHKAASQSFTVEGQPVYYTQEQSKPPVSQNEPKQHFLWRGRPRRGRI